jgi:5'-nucleotidase
MTLSTYRILVTNDDGIPSTGLGVLAQHLAEAGHDVVVAAPFAEASGSGAAIGGIMPGDVVSFESAILPHAPGVPAFAVDGAPGRCVLAAALGAFGSPPQLVVSGINPGANVGRFLQLHSGTLGAALTAAGLGINAMAVSIEHHEPTNWATAAITATRLVDYLAGCERRTALNLNLPDIPFNELNGLRTASVARRSSTRLTLTESTPGQFTFDFVPVEERTDRPAPCGETDQSLIASGHAVLTRVLPPADVTPETYPTDIV